MKYKYLFGPVPSRRLGASLGVDLIPFKTCTLNCVYCECGKTTTLTTERKKYIPLDSVKEELADYLSQKPTLDFITFAGSGEPTLNSGIESIVDFLKRFYPQYRKSLLTNGTLFNKPEVRAAVRLVDLLIPSLDAATEDAFQVINRPHPDLSCTAVIEGLIKMRQEFKGEMSLEVFIVPGLNDTLAELSALKKAIADIQPDRIQLGTLDRPGTEEWVQSATATKMKEIAHYFGNTEVIGEFQSRQTITSFNEGYCRQIMQLLRRRPCTLQDIEKTLNLHPAEIQKYINYLLETGRLEAIEKERGIFLKIKKTPEGYA